MSGLDRFFYLPSGCIIANIPAIARYDIADKPPEGNKPLCDALL